MDKRTAERLARKIERAGMTATVQPYWYGGYMIGVQDPKEGGRFMVNSPEEWEERVKAVEFGTKYTL